MYKKHLSSNINEVIKIIYFFNQFHLDNLVYRQFSLGLGLGLTGPTKDRFVFQ